MGGSKLLVEHQYGRRPWLRSQCVPSDPILWSKWKEVLIVLCINLCPPPSCPCTGVTKKHQKFIFEYWVFSQKSYLNVGCFEEIHICIPKILYLHTKSNCWQSESQQKYLIKTFVCLEKIINSNKGFRPNQCWSQFQNLNKNILSEYLFDWKRL